MTICRVRGNGIKVGPVPKIIQSRKLSRLFDPGHQPSVAEQADLHQLELVISRYSLAQMTACNRFLTLSFLKTL